MIRKDVEKTLKRIGIAILTLAVTSILILIWFINSTAEQYKNLNIQWLEYSKKEQSIVDASMHLSSILGYGGMIHNFKNYLLRGDVLYLQNFDTNLQAAKIELDFLKSKLSSYNELQALDIISNTISQYQTQSKKLSTLLASGMSTKLIDNKLKINDIPAFMALKLLRVEAQNRLLKAKQQTDLNIHNTEVFIKNGKSLSLPFLLLTFLLLYYMHRLNTSLKKEKNTAVWLESILNSAPDPVVIIDKKNTIIRVNQSAIELFGYSPESFIEMPVNQLIPQHSLNEHNLLHDFFIDNKESDNTATVRIMYAKTQQGSHIPIEINFSQVSNNQSPVFIATIRDITTRKLAEAKIRHQANYDSLTNVPNRMLLNQYLTKFMKESEVSKQKIAILFLDLDDFKKVNDTMGHEAGDSLLVDAALRLNKAVRKSDIVSRLGGDEFIILLNNIDHIEQVQLIINDILSVFRLAFYINNRELIVTASIGVSIYPDNGKNASELIRNADVAMYDAKKSGSNTFKFYNDELSATIKRKVVIEEQLRHGLKNNEFTVFYQPQIRLVDNKLTGFEALLRWNNHQLGFVSPEEFIPIAEQTGLIIALGNFVIEQAVKQINILKERYTFPFKIAINISPVQLKSDDLVLFIRNTLQKQQVLGSYLEIEITENVVLNENHVTYQVLNQLKQLDICIAMDDFGTGYSSLNYLRDIQFDVLKIDRSFVAGMLVNESDYKLISATISMAKAFNLIVIAEGVESKEHADLLFKLGCQIAQGYYYSKPQLMTTLLNDINLKKYMIESQPETVL